MFATPPKLTCGKNKKNTWPLLTPPSLQLHEKNPHSYCIHEEKKDDVPLKTLHPWRITWTIIMVICRFHVDLPGCTLQEVLNTFGIVQFFLRVQQISYHFVSDKTPIYLPCGFLSKPPTIKKLQMFIKFFSSWPQQLSWIFSAFVAARSLAMQGVKICSNLMGLARCHLVGTEP